MSILLAKLFEVSYYIYVTTVIFLMSTVNGY